MTQDAINKAFEGRWRIKGNFGQINSNSATMSFDKFYDYIKGLCRDFFETGISLGILNNDNDAYGVGNGGIVKESDIVESQQKLKSKNLFERSIPFNQSVFTTENEKKYGQQMLQDFYEYWSEPNPSHTKMRFELQKTWDVNRRLARWARNNFNRYDRQQQPTIEQQRLSKLAEILTDQ